MKVNVGMLAAQVGGMFLVISLSLFLAAGTVGWPAGWAFLALFFGFTLALSLWLLRHHPGLLTERLTGMGAAGQPTWDKVFFLLANLGFLAWLVLMPLDAARFRWTRLPAGAQVAGALLLLWAFVLFFLTFRENAYLSPAVRLQSGRGQVVVSTGPYRLVRHPMYAGALLFFVGTALLLGSAWGLALGLLLEGGVAWRAVREEELLRRALPGYAAYLARVRYRLIPGVW